jgi:hypothetical protein
VEDEQQGSERAHYSESVLKELSKRLTADFGKGFTVANIEYFRKFYIVFSGRTNSDALRRNSKSNKTDALRWTFDEENDHYKSQTIDQRRLEPSNFQNLRRELSWTHYRLLMRVEDETAREYYMNEAADQNWSTRTLERQINSLYFQRLLSSKDKEALIERLSPIANKTSLLF